MRCIYFFISSPFALICWFMFQLNLILKLRFLINLQRATEYEKDERAKNNKTVAI